MNSSGSSLPWYYPYISSSPPRMKTRYQPERQARRGTKSQIEQQLKPKRQIRTRSVSSSASSTGPGPKRKKHESCRANMSGGTHKWDVVEEGILVQCSRDPNMVKLYQQCPQKFYKKIGDIINSKYKGTEKYVELDPKKVGRKFQRLLNACAVHYSRAEQTDEVEISKAQLRTYLSADSTSCRSKSVSKKSLSRKSVLRKSANMASEEPLNDKAAALTELSDHGVTNIMLPEYAKLLNNPEHLFIFSNVMKNFDEKLKFLDDLLVKMGTTA